MRITAPTSADVATIREEIISNEQERVLLPYDFIIEYYAEKVLDVITARNYAPYREVKARTKRQSGKNGVPESEGQQNRTGSGRGSKGSSTANGVTTNKYSIPAEASVLLERYEKGKISRENIKT